MIHAAASGIAPQAADLPLRAWSEALIHWTVEAGLVVLAAGMALCILRIVRGPHLADRAVGADTLAVQLAGVVILLSLRLDTLRYFDGVLLLSLLGFAATVAVAQYIARPHLRRSPVAHHVRPPPEVSSPPDRPAPLAPPRPPAPPPAADDPSPPA